MNYNFTVPVVYAPEDNSSYIGKTSIVIKDCSIFGRINDECDGYNFNRCPNDDAYCQPFIYGDKIFRQFALDINTYPFGADFTLINTNTGLPFFDFTYEQFIDYPIDPTSTTKYFNLYIDTTDNSGESPTCWYIKIKLYKTGGEDPEFDLITSEPYCSVQCSEPTLLIEGIYPAYDCNGAYYGLYRTTPTAVLYRALTRVRGVVEPSGYTMEKTFNGKQSIKSKQSERFTFFSEKLPYYVAQQLAVEFNSKQLIIDGIEYKGQLKLDKNFEEGSEWIIKEDIFIDCDELNFTCE